MSEIMLDTTKNFVTDSCYHDSISTSTTFRRSLKHAGAQQMDCTGRTQGDGMENTPQDTCESKQMKSRLGDTLIYHPQNLKHIDSIPPVMPSGMIVNLVPKSITNRKREKHIFNSLKTKEPKFVPYEPYKAAVNPIIPYEKSNKKPRGHDLHINSAVSRVAAINLNEKITIIEGNINDNVKKVTDLELTWDIERKMYETEIHKLKEENGQLENQLKFQTQVNGELKNLLVAAVGEDLETKVHLLTEDKVQLARALLNSAQHLNTHQEQTEWLAGQCEVWRSKFLASSLMVEELAKWKAGLCQRTTDLQETIKRMLEEHNQIRDTSLKTYTILGILREKFDPVGAASRKKQLPSTNIIDLAQGCYRLAEILKIQLLSGMQDINLQKELDTTGLEMKTPAEKIAEQLLMNPNFLTPGRQDAVCSAVMGAAFAIGRSAFLSETNDIVCCSHCSGEVKQI